MRFRYCISDVCSSDLRPGPAQFGDESAELRATEPESDFGRFGEIAHDGKAETMTAPGLVDPHAALRRAGDGLFGHAGAVVLDGADEVIAVVASDDAGQAPRVASRILYTDAEHLGQGTTPRRPTQPRASSN